jgi:hypothetical protein
MSLLDTASLIVTPNAYKEGKLYSVIPSDGSGDMSVVRATTATRVNSAGLVELVPYNLVEYSEQFNDAYWTKSNSSITANNTTAPNGTSTADKLVEDTSNSVHRMFNNGAVAISTLDGTTYSFYLKSAGRTRAWVRDNDIVGALFNLSNGTIVSTEGTATATITSAGDGWYRCTITRVNSNGNGRLIVYLDNGTSDSYTGNGTDGVFIWGAQLVEGTNALPYQKTETRLNIPRLDYSLGGCPNILLEPQRTNLATYSEQFDDASWNKINSSVTANADISPDGYTNTDRIYDNAASGQHRVGKNISVVSATTYTFSVFAKKGSLRYCYLFTVAGGASDRYYFDLQDGVSITAGGKIEDYGSGWYRISAQVTAAATGNELFAFNLTNSPSSPTYSGTGTGYHMIYGYQVEAGNYQTSYIPTTTASVTRNQDVLSKTGITSLIGQTEGTVYIEFDNLLQSSYGSESVLTLYGSANDQIFIRKESGTNYYTIRLRANSVNAFTFTGVNVLNGRNKIAISYKSGENLVYLNGVEIGNSSATWAFITNITDVNLGHNNLSAIGLNRVYALGLWKEITSAAQLAQLTTI